MRKNKIKDIEGIEYILLDEDKFDNQGNIKSLRDIFREINGKTYIFEDGSFFKVVKKVGKINIYDEFMKKLPASNVGDKTELREINKLIAKNSDEILGNTRYESLEPDHHIDKHHANGLYVVGFDRRSVNILNRKTGDSYQLLISIADLKNGDKVLYAKKYLCKKGNIKEKMSSVKDQGHLLTIISQIKSLLSSIIKHYQQINYNSYVKRTSRITLTAMCLAIGIMLPQATHFLPEVANKFSLMHIPAYIAGIICGPFYGLFVGVFSPLFSMLFFNMPKVPTVYSMMIELGSYGLFTGLLSMLIKTKFELFNIYSSLIISMIIGKIIYGICNALIFKAGAYSFVIWITAAFVNGILGIILHLIIIPPICLLLKKRINYNK